MGYALIGVRIHSFIHSSKTLQHTASSIILVGPEVTLP